MGKRKRNPKIWAIFSIVAWLGITVELLLKFGWNATFYAWVLAICFNATSYWLDEWEKQDAGR